MAANDTAFPGGQLGETPSYEILTAQYYAATAIVLGAAVQLSTMTLGGQTIVAASAAAGPAANVVGIAGSAASIGQYVTVVHKGVVLGLAGATALTAGENLSPAVGTYTLGAASATVGDNCAVALQAIAANTLGYVFVSNS